MWVLIQLYSEPLSTDRLISFMHQTHSSGATRHYPSSIFKTLGIIYREEGVRVLFSGVAPRVIWISAGGAVFLGVYEAAKKAIDGRAAADASRSVD